MQTTQTTYTYAELPESDPRVLNYALRILGVSFNELEAVAIACARSYKSGNGTTQAGRELHAEIMDLFDNCATSAKSLSKTLRAAESTGLAVTQRMPAPTHIGRCAGLVGRAAIQLRDAFIGHETGCADSNRPTDLEIDLSVSVSLAPLLNGETSATWHMEANTYQSNKKRTDKFVKRYSLVTLPNAYPRNENGTVTGVTVTLAP